MSGVVAGAALLAGASPATAHEVLSRAVAADTTTQSTRPCGESVDATRLPSGGFDTFYYYWRNCRNVGDRLEIQRWFYPIEYKCVPEAKTELVETWKYSRFSNTGEVFSIKSIGDC